MTKATKMPITGLDVAKKANVSKMTVSRVLSGKHDLGISPATRERVLRAARELDYHPNTIARSFRRRSTNIIGFYSSDGWVTPYDPFFAAVIHGLRQGCDDAGKNFLIYGGQRRRSDDAYYAEFMNGQLDGLVVLMKPDEPLVRRLAESSLPVVAIADNTSPLPSVLVDDGQGSRLIAEYLAGKGHKRVLYRRGIGDEDPRLSIFRRYEAFRRAAADLGITVLEGSGVYDPVGKAIRISARETELFTGPVSERPTAAVCYDDDAAYSLLADCRGLGIRVPDDLAIVGFDGCPAVAGQTHRLTTIDAHWSDVVSKAIECVIDLREGREVPAETKMPVTLMVGETA
jgi:DNA-binding LacI/PurR family transcriptional regulator